MSTAAPHDPRPAGAGAATRGDVARQAAVVLAFVAVVAVNVLANALPIAGRDTGQVSDAFPVAFTPAGWAFSIWGLIYFGLGAYATFQARPGERANPRMRALAWPFVASCACNVAWIFAWHNLRIPASMGLMLALLASLIVAYERLRRAPGAASATRLERWAAWAPFSVYLGWITVATAANASVLGWYAGWRPPEGVAATWAAAVVVVAAAVALTVLARRRDAAFALAPAWAFAAIASARWGVPPVSWVALGACALLLLAVIAVVAARRPPIGGAALAPPRAQVGGRA